MSDGPTLVAGATGALGLQICTALAARGTQVRALVRPTANVARVTGLRDLGAEIVQGDLELPETLAPAVAGISAVITTASSFPRDGRSDAIDRMERAGSINLVDAAVAAGVEKLVFTSFREIVPDFPFQQAKRAVEAHLARSGLAYTVLRPASFMDVWFSPMLGFDVAAGEVTVYGDGKEPLSWMCAADVARFALWALDADQARNATLDLGGPEAVSQLEAIALYEELTGRPLDKKRLPLEELARMYADAASPLELSLAGVMLGVARGGVTDMSELAALSGIRLTSVREFAPIQLAHAS
jgi:uncharacterized protein YbjT (DUF2867 family)